MAHEPIGDTEMKHILILCTMMLLVGCTPMSLTKARMSYLCSPHGGVVDYLAGFLFNYVWCADGTTFGATAIHNTVIPDKKHWVGSDG